jgi:hypothetical protein
MSPLWMVRPSCASSLRHPECTKSGPKHQPPFVRVALFFATDDTTSSILPINSSFAPSHCEVPGGRPVSYLSFHTRVGYNSRFIGLSDDDYEELSGVLCPNFSRRTLILSPWLHRLVPPRPAGRRSTLLSRARAGGFGTICRLNQGSSIQAECMSFLPSPPFLL